MKKQNNKQGFTIIEVVLVLAIAGLIFLMVFVALPSLQRSQRDTQRRNDMARVDTALTQYQTNNQNTNGGTNLPTEGAVAPTDKSDYTGCEAKSTDSACQFLRRYMNAGDDTAAALNEFQDADGTYYGISITKFGNAVQTASDATFTYGLALTTSTEKDSENNKVAETSSYEYTGTTVMDHVIYIIVSGKCDGEKAVKGSNRDYAVLYRLEGSGVYCIDNR